MHRRMPGYGRLVLSFLLSLLMVIPLAAQDDGFGDDDGFEDDGGFEDSGGGHVSRNLDLIDTPTTNTLEKGNYAFSFTGYNEGGILSKGLIGLHNNFYLGVSFDVERAIGEEEPTANVPGAIAKIRFTDGDNDNFGYRSAIGYDSFYAGPSGKTNTNFNPFAQALYGPYAVLSRPVYLFGMEQVFSFGLRVPMQPNYRPNETAMFFGLEAPLSQQFYAMLEVERLYFDTDRWHRVLINVGLRYNLFDTMGLELNFMMGSSITPNRMLVFEYSDKF